MLVVPLACPVQTRPGDIFCDKRVNDDLSDLILNNNLTLLDSLVTEKFKFIPS